MNKLTFLSIYEDSLAEGAYIHDVYPGFKEDYLILHCLLRIHQPKSVFEVGSNVGSGLLVMRAALPDAKLFSLDLDYETMMHNSKQYPIGDNGEDRVGSAARHIKYTQLRGDSLKFDYYKYPCEAYYIDGEHDFEHPYSEGCAILDLNPKLVVFHDADMDPVAEAIAALEKKFARRYDFFRVTDTRIAFAVKK